MGSRAPRTSCLGRHTGVFESTEHRRGSGPLAVSLPWSLGAHTEASTSAQSLLGLRSADRVSPRLWPPLESAGEAAPSEKQQPRGFAPEDQTGNVKLPFLARRERGSEAAGRRAQGAARVPVRGTALLSLAGCPHSTAPHNARSAHHESTTQGVSVTRGWPSPSSHGDTHTTRNPSNGTTAGVVRAWRPQSTVGTGRPGLKCACVHRHVCRALGCPAAPPREREHRTRAPRQRAHRQPAAGSQRQTHESVPVLGKSGLVSQESTRYRLNTGPLTKETTSHSKPKA